MLFGTAHLTFPPGQFAPLPAVPRSPTHQHLGLPDLPRV